MEFFIFRAAVILLGCALAGYTDIKSGLIPDRITYPMIAIGVALNLYGLINGAEIWVLGIGAIVFAVGCAIYYFGKMGGGDVKLFTAIALLLPFHGSQVFLLPALFVAALSAVVFLSAYYVLKYARKGINIRENFRGLVNASFLGIVVILYFVMLVQLKLMRIDAAALLLVPMAFAVLFIAFEQGIRKNFFLKKIKLAELEEDEVIAAEHLDEETKKKLKLHGKGVLGKKEIDELKKLGLEEVPVYRDLPPFAPFILIGVAIALWQPNLIEMLFL